MFPKGSLIRFMKVQRKIQPWLFAIVLSVGMVLASNPTHADERYAGEPPSAAAMSADLLLIRPLSLVATVVGTAVFVVSLPFSLLGQNTEDAAQQLVVRPGEYTFVRPLGDFQDALAARSRN